MKHPTHLPATTLSSAYHLIGAVGLSMAGCILAGTWAGIKLDAWLDGGGLGTAAGILGGILAGASASGVLLARNIPWKP